MKETKLETDHHSCRCSQKTASDPDRRFWTFSGIHFVLFLYRNLEHHLPRNAQRFSQSFSDWKLISYRGQAFCAVSIQTPDIICHKHRSRGFGADRENKLVMFYCFLPRNLMYFASSSHTPRIRKVLRLLLELRGSSLQLSHAFQVSNGCAVSVPYSVLDWSIC